MGLKKDSVLVGSSQDHFRRMKMLQCLYTTGCNIPIFVSGHKEIVAIDRPVPTFQWYNFFDEDDVLGWPLEPLSESYKNLVQDISINAGDGVISTLVKSWNPFSHNQYWTDKRIINHLSATIQRLA